MSIYSESLLNGQISVISSSKIIDVDSDLLLFSDSYGFHLYDISQPSSPALVGRTGVPGLAGRFIIDNSYAYVSTWDGLAIIDYRNPAVPVVLGRVSINNKAYDVEVNGDTVFVSTATGLEAYNVSDKINPVLITSIAIDSHQSNHNLALHPSGTILYYTTGRRLYVLDVADPGAIQIITSTEFNPTTMDGTCHDGPKVNGNHLYVPVTTALHIYDINTPTNPLLIYEANPTSPNTLYSAAVRGDLFITGHWSSGSWSTIDVSNPPTPQIIQSYPAQTFGYGHGIGKIVNDLFFLINNQQGTNQNRGWRIRIIDVSNPAAATELSHIDSPNSGHSIGHQLIQRGEAIYSLVAQDNYTYNSGNPIYAGLFRILDVTDPANPVLKSTIDVDKRLIAIAANDSFVVVRGYSLGFLSYEHFLYLISIVDPENPLIIDLEDNFPGQSSNDFVNSLYIHDNKLYVTLEQGFRIYDISSGSFQLLNTISTLGEASRSIKVREFGNDLIAYVAGGIKGLQIYNVNDPSNVFMTGFYQSPGIAWDVWLVDELAYVALGTGGVQIFNVSNNIAQPISIFATSAQAKNIVVENNLAFVNVFASGSDSKMEVFDISNPNSPSQLGVYQTSGLASQVSVSHNGRRLYMSDRYSHTIYRPLFNFMPLPFSLIAPEDSSTASGDVQFVWQKAEDANDDSLSYDLTIWSASWDTTLTVSQDTSLIVSNNVFPASDLYQWTVKVSDGQFVQNALDTFLLDMVVTNIEDEKPITPHRYALHQNYPNPFNLSTTIRFDLSAASEVEITIHNSLGQAVNHLVSSKMPAGQHQVNWDGKLASGGEAPSGIYFIVLKAKPESGAADFRSTIKAILMK